MGDEVPSEPGSDPDAQQSAEDMAKLLLRAKNIKEFHSVLTTAGSLTFPNGVAIDSGLVVTFKNKGLFDGNWIIQKYTLHLVEGKVETEIEFRKCLVPLTPGYRVVNVSQPSDQGYNPMDPFDAVFDTPQDTQATPED